MYPSLKIGKTVNFRFSCEIFRMASCKLATYMFWPALRPSFETYLGESVKLKSLLVSVDVDELPFDV